MKKLILLLMACSVIVNLTALEWDSTVPMPTEKVLSSRLRVAGFDYLERHINLSGRLTRTPLTLGGVAVAVDSALYDFNQCLGNPVMAVIMDVHKPKLLDTVLQDIPGAAEVIHNTLAAHAAAASARK